MEQNSHQQPWRATDLPFYEEPVAYFAQNSYLLPPVNHSPLKQTVLTPWATFSAQQFLKWLFFKRLS